MYHRAQPLLEAVLRAITRTLSPDSPSAADALRNLAVFFRCKGDDTRALSLHEQVPSHRKNQTQNPFRDTLQCLAVRSRILGELHPPTLQSLSDVADTLFIMAEYTTPPSSTVFM
jgi:hypothetical protein